MSEDTEKEILLRAAEYLGEHGWTQGTLYDNKAEDLYDNKAEDLRYPAACAMGAMGLVTQLEVFADHPVGSWEATTAREAAQGRLIRHVFGKMPLAERHTYTETFDEDHKHPIARWNDRPERTVEDVILALKGAASE